MLRLLRIAGVVLGLGLVYWIGSLIQHNYSLGRDHLYMVKAGINKISPEVERGHSEQAAKDVVVHLGLALLGAAITVISISLRNKAIKVK